MPREGKSLRDLQLWFQNRVTAANPDRVHDDEVRETEIFRRQKRLSIYSNAYLLRLEEALMEDFQKLHHLLGADFFADLVHQYARTLSWSSHTLADFGRDFADFLSRAPGAVPPWAADIARLEWAFSELFYAPEDQSADEDLIRTTFAQAPEQIELAIGSAVRFFDTMWPLDEMLNKDVVPHEPLPRPSRYCVYRSRVDGDSYFIKLRPFETTILDGIVRGENLAVIFELVEKHHADDPELTPEAIRENFEEWMGKGIIRLAAEVSDRATAPPKDRRRPPRRAPSSP